MSKALTLSLQNKPTEIADSKLGAWYKKSALRRLVNRADVYHLKPHTEFERSAYLFHQPSTLPSAATQASCDLDDFDTAAYWLNVDPVQMIADRDALIMFPPDQLVMSQVEREQLGEAFNAHFSSQGVVLKFGKSGGWYLKLPQRIDLQTVPLSQACNCNLYGLYPSGHASAYWRALMNEAQMLFYNHPVNIQRRETDQPEINSIWIWGEGQLDYSQILARPNAMIFSDSLYGQGMAKLTQADYQTQPKNYQAWWSQSEQAEASLVELTVDWSQGVDLGWQQLNQDWLEPLEQDLRSEKVNSVFLDLNQLQGLLLEPKNLKRFWRWRDRLQLG